MSKHFNWGVFNKMPKGEREKFHEGFLRGIAKGEACFNITCRRCPMLKGDCDRHNRAERWQLWLAAYGKGREQVALFDDDDEVPPCQAK